MALHIKEDQDGNKRILTKEEFESERRAEAFGNAFNSSVKDSGAFATVIGYILMFLGTIGGWYWFVVTSDMWLIFRIFVGIFVGALIGGVLMFLSLMILGKK